MKHSQVYFTLATLAILSSCSSYKGIPYFQDASENTFESVQKAKPLTVQPSDILGISVTSKNPEAALLFNYNLAHVNGTNFIAPDNPVTGYRVDDKGDIQLPLIGTFHVKDMTTDQIREQINKKLLTYYLDPVVNIRLINFKVAVYGDVQRPDIYTLKNEYTTLTQVLTMAGDLNVTARRDNILLVRYEDGKRKMIRLDLTSKDIFDSPYFQLQNNDEIYVTPGRSKLLTVNRGYYTATLLLSALSVAAIVFSAVYN